MESELNQTKPLLVELVFNPKTYEIDFAGIVSNIIYIKWMEDLRLAMLAKYLPLDELIAEGKAPTIISTTITYKDPVQLGELVVGEMWVDKLGGSSWVVSCKFSKKGSGKIAAEGSQKGVLVETQTGRPARLPEHIKTAYASQLSDG